MERVRQIAATGIDGIYVDIPYWMTHFDGWEEHLGQFRRLHRRGIQEADRIGCPEGPETRRFLRSELSQLDRFRIQAITDFMQEIDRNAKSVNPAIKTIPEIYPGIEEEVGPRGR